MASKNPKADAIFKDCPNVSKDPLTVDDALAVQNALKKVLPHISNIAQVLALHSERIKEIERIHKGDDRRAIAIIDTWLRRDYNDKRPPYSIPDYPPCPSWWNLVWAVSHKTGGQNAAHAKKIAQEYKTFCQSSAESKFQGVSTDTLEEAEDARDELESVWHRWYEIGAALKISTATLDQIEGKDQPPEEKMLTMLQTWIRDTISDPLPSWRLLLEAVAASHGGGNGALADKLAKEHGSTEGNSSPSIGKDNGEFQPMEVETAKVEPAMVEPSSTTIGQVQQVVSEDSILPHTTTETVSDPQPDIPLVSIAEDGGKPRTADQFIVYSRNKHSSGGKPSHGLALVIANQKFDAAANLAKRVCTPYDDERLRKTLTTLGYRVVFRHNQTGQQMNDLFKTLKQNDPGELHIKKEDDSFICVISSHGDWDSVKNTDMIYGYDRGTLFLQETAYENLGADVCSHLKGKPKLFFVQACRGPEYGRIADDSGTQVKVPPRLPREADFLFSFSTAPHTKSFRFDPNRPAPEGDPIDLSGDGNYDGYKVGSFYITELCFAFHQYGPKMDLMNMVLSVHHMLQAAERHLFHLGSKTTRQCPHMTVSLRGPVFFCDEAENLFKEYMKKCLK